MGEAMSWSYRLAKQKGDNGSICYSIVEVYKNRNGGIWGWTDHTDPFGWIQDESPEDTDEDALRDDIQGTLEHLLKDVVFNETLDLDHLRSVRPDFQDELDDILKEHDNGS